MLRANCLEAIFKAMTNSESSPAIFVCTTNARAAASGGVQVYTREMIATLERALFDLSIVEYQPDQRPVTKLKRKLRPKPYANLLPPDLPDRVAAAQRENEALFVFLNGVDLAPLAAALRTRLPEITRIVLLSYGLESVDFLHTARARGGMTSAAAERLGAQQFAECHQREAIDHVFCLAPFEAEIERWLGAKKVDWLPRTLPPGNALAWQPDPNRIGCVGTLDHPPNWEGLVLFLRELESIAPPNLRFRLVGGPENRGRELAHIFLRVDYLGSLDDAAVAAEAKTWSCFVHPLFCYARGCSTKLAVALGWRIPVVTTQAGARGYVWREGRIPLAETPAGLAALAVRLLQPTAAADEREQVELVANSMPERADVAGKIRDALSVK
jgi:glycosyltransferase involved in cell wall biosynthesis